MIVNAVILNPYVNVKVRGGRVPLSMTKVNTLTDR